MPIRHFKEAVTIPSGVCVSDLVRAANYKYVEEPILDHPPLVKPLRFIPQLVSLGAIRRGEEARAELSKVGDGWKPANLWQHLGFGYKYQEDAHDAEHPEPICSAGSPLDVDGALRLPVTYWAPADGPKLYLCFDDASYAPRVWFLMVYEIPYV